MQHHFESLVKSVGPGFEGWRQEKMGNRLADGLEGLGPVEYRLD